MHQYHALCNVFYRVRNILSRKLSAYELIMTKADEITVLVLHESYNGSYRDLKKLISKAYSTISTNTGQGSCSLRFHHQLHTSSPAPLQLQQFPVLLRSGSWRPGRMFLPEQPHQDEELPPQDSKDSWLSLKLQKTGKMDLSENFSILERYRSANNVLIQIHFWSSFNSIQLQFFPFFPQESAIVPLNFEGFFLFFFLLILQWQFCE